MFKLLTQDERTRLRTLRTKRWRLLALESQCYYLQLHMRRLELRAKQSTIDDRQLRREKMQIRTDLEILKIEVEELQRRVQPLLQSRSQ